LTSRTIIFRAALHQVDITGGVIATVHIAWPVTHRSIRILIPAVKVKVTIRTSIETVTLCASEETWTRGTALPELGTVIFMNMEV